MIPLARLAAVLMLPLLASCATVPGVVAGDQAANRLLALWGGLRSDIHVRVQVYEPELRIGSDVLRGEVSTDRAGYLTVLQAGSDGRELIVIWPRAGDLPARIDAGTHRLPPPGWDWRANGPAGTGALLAIISEQPLDSAALLAGRAQPSGRHGAAAAVFRERAAQ